MIIKPSNVNRGDSNVLPYLPNPSSHVASSMFTMTAYPLQFTMYTAQAAAQLNTSSQAPVIQVLGRNQHAIQVSGTFSASVLIEATLDGTNWFTLDTITTPSVKQYSGLYESIRASIPSFTSGAITVTAISQRS